MKVLMVDPGLIVGQIDFVSSKMHEVFVQLERLGVNAQSQKFWLGKTPPSLAEFEKEEKNFFRAVADETTNGTVVIIRFIPASLERAIRLTFFLKEKQPNITIAYGGSAATLLSHQSPILNPLYFVPVDALIVGEGDITIPEYIKAISDRNTKKLIPGIKKLTKLFIPRSYLCLENLSPLSLDSIQKIIGNYPINSPDKLKIEIEASRGCLRKCCFCEMSAMHQHQIKNGYRVYRLQRIDSLVANLNHLYDHGIRRLFFGDLIFPWQKGWIDSLKRAEILNKFNQVDIYSSTDKFVQPGYLERLASIGVTKISVGVETVTERFLKWAGKPVIPLKDLETALEKAKLLNIKVRLSWIFGFPTETLSELKASIEQAIIWSKIGLIKNYDFHNFYPRLDQIGRGDYLHLGREYILQNGRFNLPLSLLSEAIQKYNFQWNGIYHLEHFIQQIAQLQLIPPLGIYYGSSKITIQDLVDLTRIAMEETYSGLTDPW